MERRDFFRNVLGAAAALAVPGTIKDIVPEEMFPQLVPGVPGINPGTFTIRLAKDAFVAGDVIVSSVMGKQFHVSNVTEEGADLNEVTDKAERMKGSILWDTPLIGEPKYMKLYSAIGLNES